MSAYLDLLLFGIYPYLCLAVFLLGSLVRFDREIGPGDFDLRDHITHVDGNGR